MRDETLQHCLRKSPILRHRSRSCGRSGQTLLVMVPTPRPNMIYLISRSTCQARKAGVISLFGVMAGFLLHMLAAQRWLTGCVLGALAVRLALEQRRGA